MVTENCMNIVIVVSQIKSEIFAKKMHIVRTVMKLYSNFAWNVYSLEFLFVHQSYRLIN